MNHLVDATLASTLDKVAYSLRADVVLAYLDHHGQSNYDASVTQLEHALQTAALARSFGAAPAMVTSALLHDIGHLLVDEHTATGDFLDHDLGHEKVAATYLSAYFGEDVTEPIRLHVRAKRYLCTVEPDYRLGLSAASTRSLEVQGGVLSEREVAELEANPYLAPAVELRRWDDRAKVSGAVTPELVEFRDDVQMSLLVPAE